MDGISLSSLPGSQDKSLLHRAVPWLLLSVRVCLTPVVLFAPPRLTDRTILWFYVAAFVTDYFDGVVARRLGTATPRLRKADGTADTFFYLAVAATIFRRHPGELRNNLPMLIVYLVTVSIWCAMDVLRWRRYAGFHTYTAKLFSIALLVWMVMLLGGHGKTHALSVAMAFGTVANLDGIAISLMLTKDRVDVASVFSARRRRPDSPVEDPAAPARTDTSEGTQS